MMVIAWRPWGEHLRRGAEGLKCDGATALCPRFVDRRGALATTFGIGANVVRCRANRGLSSSSARYDELQRECLAAQPGDNVAFGPGTLGFVIEKYLASADYISKAPGTQRHYRGRPRSVEGDLRPRVNCRSSGTAHPSNTSALLGDL